MAVVPKESGTLSKISEEGQRAFAGQKMSARDVLIPRVLVMQAGSEKVLGGQATFGELRDNLENKALGKIGEPLEFIPIHAERLWIVVEENGGKRTFVEAIKVNEDNENLPFEETINGKHYIRTYTISVYGLIPSEVASGEDMPYILSFRSTSLRAGKKLLTLMYVRNQRAGRDPWAASVAVSVEKQQNEKGTFAVLDVQTKRASTAEEVEAAKYWFNLIQKGAAKISEDTETVESQPAPDSGGAF